jgi:hypothetical protein
MSLPEKVTAQGAVISAAIATTVLESSELIRMDKDPRFRASQQVPYRSVRFFPRV